MPTFLLFLSIFGAVLGKYTAETPVHYNVANEIFKRYHSGFLPKRLNDKPIVVNFSMELYQIIEINEPQKFLSVNAWTVERWVDNIIGWDSQEHANLTEILIPSDKIWLPDTTLYNSLVMDDSQTKRMMSVKLITRGKGKGALVELLYPAIYKQTCSLDLRFFPFDLQSCSLIFGSWTHDNTLIDYVPHSPEFGIGTGNCIENEGWEIISTSVERQEHKYACCPNNYTLLEFRLHVQRKPLYYIISLILPTSLITFTAILGFFSSPSINDLREEKITLGITTLLSFSILVFMVSDKIPSTSSFILIGWFYTSMILLISLGTICSSLVIFVQKKGLIGNFPDPKVMSWAQLVAKFVQMEMPLLMRQAYARKAYEEKQKKAQQSRSRRTLWYKLVDAAKEQAKKTEEAEKKASISNYYATGSRSEKSPNCSHQRDSIDSLEPPSPSNLRTLAQLEFDWLAAVVERIFLILFILLFLFFSFGINFIGFLKWKYATVNK